MPNALSVAITNGIALVTFDLQGAPVNTFTREVRDEFAEVLGRLQADVAVKAIVLVSGKPDVFIAGADIDEFTTVHTAADAERLSRDGKALLARLEKGKPIVAAIHGACLGGGLEAALACSYRICTDSPKTVLALPEVQLGLIPGAGGTQRLPRTIGLRAALDMMLTGKNVRAKKALAIGLVDEMVHPAILVRVAMERAAELSAGTRRHEKHRGGAQAALLDENPIGRRVVFRQAREQVAKKSRGHYPAPLAAIDAVEAGYRDGVERGYADESRLFGELAVSEVSRQLVFLFFATTALKKDTGVDGPSPAALPVEKLGVIGAGFMGAGIASVAAPAGTLVRLKDADTKRVGAGLRAVREVLRERLTKKQVTRQQFDDQMSMVGGTVDYSGFGSVDLVIEAVFEDVTVKHQVLREVEAVAKPGLIFASNTSTIPIRRIASASAHPENVLGMHFFSPVHKMPLLEIIVTPETSPRTTVTAVAYGRTLGKTVIVVHDGPGFYANRVLSPYVNEAGKLLDDGVAVDAIDRALTAFGFPVGPITLVDEVGIDVAAKAGGILAAAYPDRMAPARSLHAVIGAGRLGRKGRKGFYQYDAAGKKGDVDPSVYELFAAGVARRTVSPDEIVHRTVFAMLNESVRCLEDGILRSARDGDVGAVFGIGFPPFRGGPFRYIDTLGVATVVRTLEALDARFPGRYEPAAMLREMAGRGARFYER